jgi:hypothetical protein
VIDEPERDEPTPTPEEIEEGDTKEGEDVPEPANDAVDDEAREG